MLRTGRLTGLLDCEVDGEITSELIGHFGSFPSATVIRFAGRTEEVTHISRAMFVKNKANAHCNGRLLSTFDIF
jgi:hypothetical protein